MGDGFIINRGSIEDPRRLPSFEYHTIEAQLSSAFKLRDKGVIDGIRKWRIDFYLDGTFVPTYDISGYVALVDTITNEIKSTSSHTPVQLKAGIPVDVRPYSDLNKDSFFGTVIFPSYESSKRSAFICLTTLERGELLG